MDGFKPERLRSIRLARGLGQEDLAARSGAAQNTISEAETGRRTPRPSTLRKLAGALDVEVGDFFEVSTSPKADLQRRISALREFPDQDQSMVFRFRAMLVERAVEQELRRFEAALQRTLDAEEGEAAFALLQGGLEDLGEDARRAARDYKAAMERVREFLRRADEQAGELPAPEEDDISALRERVERLMPA